MSDRNIYLSLRAGFSISKPPQMVPVLRESGEKVFKEHGAKHIQFKDGRYSTADPDEIEYLEDHDAFGIDFFKAGDEGLPAELQRKKATQASASPQPNAGGNKKASTETAPLTPAELAAKAGIVEGELEEITEEQAEQAIDDEVNRRVEERLAAMKAELLAELKGEADQAGEQLDAEGTTRETAGDATTADEANGASGASDSSDELEPIEGITNRNDAMEALVKRGADLSELGLTTSSTKEEIKQAAEEAGYQFVGY